MTNRLGSPMAEHRSESPKQVARGRDQVRRFIEGDEQAVPGLGDRLRSSESRASSHTWGCLGGPQPPCRLCSLLARRRAARLLDSDLGSPGSGRIRTRAQADPDGRLWHRKASAGTPSNRRPHLVAIVSDRRAWHRQHRVSTELGCSQGRPLHPRRRINLPTPSTIRGCGPSTCQWSFSLRGRTASDSHPAGRPGASPRRSEPYRSERLFIAFPGNDSTRRPFHEYTPEG